MPNSIKDASDPMVESLLALILDRYGYDFSKYNQDVIARRVEYVLDYLGIPTIEELKQKVLQDESIFQSLLANLTIDVSCMFRDIDMFLYLRKHVIPKLKSYPSVRVWVAGCASGQEAYSISILLHEEGLGDRSVIYATDVNKVSLRNARNASYSLENARTYSKHYTLSGGKQDFYDYITVGKQTIRIKERMRKNILFAKHNLVTDGIFNQFHIVICCNVMIYFTPALKNQTLNLFSNSLEDYGYLIVGSQESILGTEIEKDYNQLEPNVNIYKKKNPNHEHMQ